MNPALQERGVHARSPKRRTIRRKLKFVQTPSAPGRFWEISSLALLFYSVELRFSFSFDGCCTLLISDESGASTITDGVKGDAQTLGTDRAQPGRPHVHGPGG